MSRKMKSFKRDRVTGRREETTVRFSIAFKASLVYTLLFGLALAAAVGVLTWGLAVRTGQDRRLQRALSQIEVQERGPGKNIDLDAYAHANNLYIEIGRGKKVSFYGERPVPGRTYAEIRRRAAGPPPPGGLSIRVVDLEDPGPAGLMTLPNFLAALAALILIAAFSGAMLMRRMIRPVYDMTRTARSITASDLSRRIEPVRSRDEFSELAGTLNEMLDRIQAAYEQQKRFVSDASHELRTPLSVILGYANLLRRWGGEDKAVRDEAVTKIVEEAGSMQSLVENLLFLARADGSRQQMHPELFCASDLMRTVAKETRLIDDGHAVEERIEPGVMMTADPEMMKQAVRAVAENSVKYTQAGGRIAFSCRRVGNSAVLTVEDNGAGIPQADLPHIFDRFYKADVSRTRGGSSSGLGLSIVKWIVENSGGEILVQSAPGAGTSTTFRMPAEEMPTLPE